jgi:hypothetical protein
VLRIALDGRGECERLIGGKAFARRDVDDAELTAGQCAGLIEEHRVHVSRVLEAATVAYEQAVSSAERRGDGDDERDGQTERMRTGNHEDSDDAFYDKRRVLPGHRPSDQCHRGGADGDHREQERCAVGERLRTRARCLSLCNKPHDARQRGSLTGAGHLHA